MYLHKTLEIHKVDNWLNQTYAYNIIKPRFTLYTHYTHYTTHIMEWCVETRNLLAPEKAEAKSIG